MTNSKARSPRKVSAADAKARLSELVASVAFTGDRVIIERRGRPLAAIVGLPDLERLQRHEATTDSPRGALALVGAWSDVPEADINDVVNRILSGRRRSKTGKARSVDLRI